MEEQLKPENEKGKGPRNTKKREEKLAVSRRERKTPEHCEHRQENHQRGDSIYPPGQQPKVLCNLEHQHDLCDGGIALT